MNSVIIFLIYIIGLYIVYLHRNTKTILVVDLIILLFNHSILYGEYVNRSIEHYVSELYHTNYGDIYETGIILLLIQEIVRLLFAYKYRNNEYKIKIQNKSSFVAYILIYLILVYIAIFELDRSIGFGYEVRISPLYEYSYLLFIFLLLNQGRSKLLYIASHLIAFIMIVQDLIWGGRVTSMQISLVFLMLQYHKYITLRRIVVISFPFILLFSFVGMVRGGYLLNATLYDVFNKMIERGFAIDTAYYAYWATMTQLYAAFESDIYTSMTSLYSFVIRVVSSDSIVNLLGGDSDLAGLTEYSKKYHFNMGGSLSFGWYFFFMGYFGVVILSSLQYYLLYKHRSKTLSILIFVALIASCGRWYLYSPLSFYRGPFVFLPIIYMGMMILGRCRLRRNKLYAKTTPN